MDLPNHLNNRRWDQRDPWGQRLVNWRNLPGVIFATLLIGVVSLMVMETARVFLVAQCMTVMKSASEAGEVGAGAGGEASVVYLDAASMISDVPLFIVTPTHRSANRMPGLVAQANGIAASRLKNVNWIVVEDDLQTNAEVSRVLSTLGLPSVTYIPYVDEDKKIVENLNVGACRGIVPRNAGIRELWKQYEQYVAETQKQQQQKQQQQQQQQKQQLLSKPKTVIIEMNNIVTEVALRTDIPDAVVYFGDDDNTVRYSMYREMSQTESVALFPVGLIGRRLISMPLISDYTGVMEGVDDPFVVRDYPFDFGGFATNIRLMYTLNSSMEYWQNHNCRIYRQETQFLQKISLQKWHPNNFQFLSHNCSQINVWHTQYRMKEPFVTTPKKSKYSNHLKVVERLFVDGSYKLPN